MQRTRFTGLLGMALLLAACGGGGDSSAPPPPPTPAATLSSGPIVVMGNVGTPLATTVTFTLNFAPAGTFGVRMESSNAVGTPFDLTIIPVSGSAGRYSVVAPLYSSTNVGFYTGTVRMWLCADVNCRGLQAVDHIDIPYTVDVLPAQTIWPGDHLTPLAAWPGAPDWNTFQGNAAHTGFVPVDVTPALITSRWRIMGNGQVLSSYNEYPQTITVAGGRFYQSGQLTLYARNESDGTVAWQHEFTKPELAEPYLGMAAVYGNSVYFVAGMLTSNYLYAFDAASGTRLYRVKGTTLVAGALPPTMGPAGLYLPGGLYGGVLGFNPATGAQLFFQEILGNVNMFTPAVDASGVYYYGRGEFRAYDPVTGNLLALIPDPSGVLSGYSIVGAPVIGAPGRVYAATYEDSIVDGGTRGNTFTAYDVPNARIAWQLSGNFPATPAYHAGHLYLPNERTNAIESRAEADGALEWSWSPPAQGGTRFRSEVLLVNNLFFVATDVATYAVDLATRQVVWSFPMSGHLALSRNGVLYIQNMQLICAFNLK